MRTSAVFTLMMPAAPKPWTTRASASVGSEVDNAQPNDATVNRISPAR